nr:MAG TPA: hypothetical protein [Inoviridae sp.]
MKTVRLGQPRTATKQVLSLTGVYDYFVSIKF